jgi:hypothetical protein
MVGQTFATAFEKCHLNTSLSRAFGEPSFDHRNSDVKNPVSMLSLAAGFISDTTRAVDISSNFNFATTLSRRDQPVPVDPEPTRQRAGLASRVDFRYAALGIAAPDSVARRIRTGHHAWLTRQSSKRFFLASWRG